METHKKNRIHVYLSDKDIENLDTICEKLGENRSVILRQALNMLSQWYNYSKIKDPESTHYSYRRKPKGTTENDDTTKPSDTSICMPS